LSNTEDQIAASRRLYNGNVQVFNTKIQQFPGVVLAGPFGFSAREFFELDDPSDREPVQVSFTS
jgi:LemA protein